MSKIPTRTSFLAHLKIWLNQNVSPDFPNCPLCTLDGRLEMVDIKLGREMECQLKIQALQP
eukprot:12652088-Prorocentrum_lima.AAC.1